MNHLAARLGRPFAALLLFGAAGIVAMAIAFTARMPAASSSAAHARSSSAVTHTPAEPAATPDLGPPAGPDLGPSPSPEVTAPNPQLAPVPVTHGRHGEGKHGDEGD